LFTAGLYLILFYVKIILIQIFSLSDGCGRTGTYLCLDANLQLAEEEGMVDIFNYAKLLRESRKGMIENVVN
jgi:protein tyrosine phosphatase